MVIRSKKPTTPVVWISCIVVIVTNLASLCSLGSPLSAIHTESWTKREITEFGLRFKLPARYKEKPLDIVVGLIQLRSFQAGFATVDFEIREETTVDRMKTGRQLNFDEYREWTDEIANHKVFIQSFR